MGMTKYAKFTKAAMAYADSFISWMKWCSIFHGLMMVVTPYTLLTVLPFGAHYVANGTLAVSDFVICIISSLGIVGPSGGGKSTLCNLIARFWDVDSGEVTLGGVNVKDYSMNSLMRNFSFVFQSVYLFADTIENNIKFGRQDASHEEVVEAAKKACCHDFISKLPDGYNTVIGEREATLSGGEKQRISIARAIMKDAVDVLKKEKTIIMIAHRLKTVRHADQIVVVDKGRIVQQGTHEQLMKQEGIYKRFVDARQQAVSWKLAH